MDKINDDLRVLIEQEREVVEDESKKTIDELAFYKSKFEAKMKILKNKLSGWLSSQDIEVGEGCDEIE
jgi:ElaB/YqjD/DUF883 family membrane-anchored ribosome-binding protein